MRFVSWCSSVALDIVFLGVLDLINFVHVESHLSPTGSRDGCCVVTGNHIIITVEVMYQGRRSRNTGVRSSVEQVRIMTPST